MKILIAIVSCNKYAFPRDCQRHTWIPELAGKGIDYKFFYGQGNPLADEVILDCSDSYEGLPGKVREICRWARAEGYDYVFKCDDDTYLVPNRLINCGFEDLPYLGNRREPSGKYKYGYALGGPGYWLHKDCINIIANAKLTEDTVEDRWVGCTLGEIGLGCVHNPNFVVITQSHQQGPRATNNIISACELRGQKMLDAHLQWKSGTSKPSYIIRSAPLPDGTYQHERVFGDINKAKE